MSHDSADDQPSTSRFFETLECRLNKNLDKISGKMKKRFQSKERNNIFVPSRQVTDTKGLGRSTSHVEQPMSSLLLPSAVVDHRRSSAPQPQEQSLGLTIDTFGGECAGSGYEWMGQDAEVTETEATLQAQELGLTKLRRKLADTHLALTQAQNDEQLLNEFLVSSFMEQLGPGLDAQKFEKINSEIASLEEELANLRRSYPQAVPPERPPRPQSVLSWRCLRCVADSPMYSFHCMHCRFPRPAIDPREALRCSCTRCTKAVADRLFVSVCPEGNDWMMVNRLNFPKSTSR